jgi:ribonuclease HII
MLFLFDKQYYEKGASFVAGVDEAGRGPLAGPVAAAAVIFPKDIILSDSIVSRVNDSKKLTPKKREVLFEEIKKKASSFFVSVVDNKVIDEINILQATFKAMSGAVEGLKVRPDLCLIDGNHKIPRLNIEQEAVIGGDAKSACIAAASILAKVTRDKIMDDYAKIYPGYSFEKHKGYGTKAHMEAILKFGACPIHRMTFAPLSGMRRIKG